MSPGLLGWATVAVGSETFTKAFSSVSTTRTRAVLIGAHGDTTWVAAHEGSGWRFSDLGPAEEVDRFEIYAEQRGRELKTVLTGAPGPRR